MLDGEVVPAIDGPGEDFVDRFDYYYARIVWWIFRPEQRAQFVSLRPVSCGCRYFTGCSWVGPTVSVAQLKLLDGADSGVRLFGGDVIGRPIASLRLFRGFVGSAFIGSVELQTSLHKFSLLSLRILLFGSGEASQRGDKSALINDCIR